MRIIFATLVLVTLISRAALGDDTLETAEDHVVNGMRLFRENKIAESIREFDKAASLDPRWAPRLWQRGISDYYAGEFKQGRQQFELHKRVNPHDVENATWHFICVARLEGVEAARKSLMVIDVSRDTRVPMRQIYRFYGGRGSQKEILDAAHSELELMYAHLYLGLYYEASGDEQAARKQMLKAAAAKLTNHYMHDVAKIHLQQRKWKLPLKFE
jgi:lipoprotein NlpI